MPIYAPGHRINPTLHRRSTIGRKSVYAGLFLTSMVDMFAILVIFLVQSFNSEGELIILPPGLELPKAMNIGHLDPAPSLVLSQDNLVFENEVIEKTDTFRHQQEWHIPRLQEALEKYKKAHEKEPPELQKHVMNISVDRRLPFKMVKKMIYNVSYAGFPDFRFAVLGSGRVESE